ncbi:MAG: siroheme synthase [Chloroflexi bacterium]|nr:siroheme synthase [Chloroflexota bacterium]
MEADQADALGVPITLQLAGAIALCVGGGNVAARRVPALLAAGAVVSVISPELHPSLQALVAGGAVLHLPRSFETGDAADAFFVLAATNDAEVNRAVAAEVRSRNGLVCVASNSTLGNCSFMSTIRRGALTIGVQTGGSSPAVAAAIRSRVENALPEDIEPMLEKLAALRIKLKARQPDPVTRGNLWRRVADSGEIDNAIAGEAGALDRIRALLEFDR